MNNFITIPMLLILVGVVLTGIGGFCATYQANKEKFSKRGRTKLTS